MQWGRGKANATTRNCGIIALCRTICRCFPDARTKTRSAVFLISRGFSQAAMLDAYSHVYRKRERKRKRMRGVCFISQETDILAVASWECVQNRFRRWKSSKGWRGVLLRSENMKKINTDIYWWSIKYSRAPFFRMKMFYLIVISLIKKNNNER